MWANIILLVAMLLSVQANSASMELSTPAIPNPVASAEGLSTPFTPSQIASAEVLTTAAAQTAFTTPSAPSQIASGEVLTTAANPIASGELLTPTIPTAPPQTPPIHPISNPGSQLERHVVEEFVLSSLLKNLKEKLHHHPHPHPAPLTPLQKLQKLIKAQQQQEQAAEQGQLSGLNLFLNSQQPQSPFSSLLSPSVSPLQSILGQFPPAGSNEEESTLPLLAAISKTSHATSPQNAILNIQLMQALSQQAMQNAEISLLEKYYQQEIQQASPMQEALINALMAARAAAPNPYSSL